MKNESEAERLKREEQEREAERERARNNLSSTHGETPAEEHRGGPLPNQKR
jgi:hypothetical protein